MTSPDHPSSRAPQARQTPPPKPPNGRKPLFRRFLVASAVALAVLILALAGGLIYLQSDHFQSLLQRRINAAIAGTVSWEDMDLSIFSGTLAVENVALMDPADREIATVSRIGVSLDWLPLISGVLQLNRVQLVQPQLVLQPHADDTLNISAALSPTGPEAPDQPTRATAGLPLEIVVSGVDIRNGRFHYVDQGRTLDVLLESISVDGSADSRTRTANLDVSVARGRIQSPDISGPLNSLRLQVAWAQDRLETVNARIDLNGLSAELDGHVEAIFSSAPRFALDLSASGLLQHLHEVIEAAPAASGRFRLQAAAKGSYPNIRGRIDLNWDGGQIAGVRSEKAVFKAQLSDTALAVEQAEIRVGEGSLTLNGTIDLARAFPHGLLKAPEDLPAIGYDLVVEADRLSLNRLPGVPPETSGFLSGRGRLDGQGWQPETARADLMLSVQGKNLTVAGETSPVSMTLETRAAIAGRKLHVESLAVSGPAISGAAQGGYDLQTGAVDTRIDLTAEDLNKTLSAFGITDARGSLHLSGRLSGDIRQPRLAFSLQTETLAWDPITIGDVALEARLGPAKPLRIERMVLKNADSRIEAKGEVQLTDLRRGIDAFGQMQLEMTLQHVSPSDFIQTDIRTKLDGTFDLGGTVREPSGELRLKAADLAIRGQSVERAELTARLRGGDTLDITGLTVDLAPGQSLRLSGRLTRQGGYRFDLSSNALNLKQIPFMDRIDSLAGHLQLTGSGQGDLQNPQATAHVTIDELVFRDQRLQPVRAELNLQNDRIQLTGRLPFPVEGSYHLDTERFSLQARFDRTELGPYFELLKQPSFDGWMTGRIAAQGRVTDPGQLNASIDLNSLTLRFKDEPLLEADAIHAVWENQTLQLTPSEMRVLSQGVVRLSGRGAADGTLSAQLSGRLPMQLAEKFSDDIFQTAGIVTFEARLQGDLDQPRVSADIELNEIEFSHSALDQRLNGINGKLHLDRDGLRVETIRGQMADGRFEIQGKLDLDRFKPVRLDLGIKAEEIPLEVPETLSMGINGRLKVTGPIENAAASGTIQVENGIYYKDFDINPLKKVGQPSRRQVEEKPPADLGHPALNRMRLDVVVTSTDPFLVENNLASLTIEPNLKVVGTLSAPVITGRTQVQDGTVRLSSTSFSVTKGIVDFINPYRTVPTLDIRAETEVRDWKIWVDISGTPDNLELKLTSEPSESEQDILSLLIAGRTTSELIDNEGGTSRSTESVLAQMLAAAAAGKIKERTGLDVFEANESAGGGVKITVGKELSDRIALKYNVTAEQTETRQQVTAEYRFIKNLILSVFQDSSGQFGGAAKWRFEFR